MCFGLQQLFLLHWISQVGFAKSQQGCWAVHRILSGIPFVDGGEREMCANLAQMYFQTKKTTLIIELL